MADCYDEATRRRVMQRVTGANTSPELQVRSFLHRAGYRFRLHRRDLPGKPDIVLPRRRTTIFVHGCFWHRHTCKRATTPASNQAYWLPKFERTVVRDKKNQRELRRLGWRVIVLWECELRDPHRWQRRLLRALEKQRG